MGFFTSQARQKEKLPSIGLMHKLECKICPLNKLAINAHPHMPASGSLKPIVYILGEAPGAAEDRDGENQFIGDSGQLLRARIPEKWLKDIRFNNVVRTRPPKNRTPEPIEIECCRPSVVRDIVATKPKAIFGFGAVPLEWAADLGHIFDWRGRRLPVNIGGHECWYYPFIHPAYLFRESGQGARRPGDIGSEDERAFEFDIKRALAEVRRLPDAVVHDENTAMYGVETVDGSKPDDLDRLTKLLEWAGKQKLCGVDYETNRLRPYDVNAKILTAAVGTLDLSFAFAVDHPQARWTPKQKLLVHELWVKFLKSRVRKASHFLNFEMEWTAVNYGKEIVRASRWEATESQAVVLDERTSRKRKGGPLSLEFLVMQHFGFNLKHLTNLDRAKLEFEPLPVVLRYNAMDAKYHCLLCMVQEDLLEQEGLTAQYETAYRRVPTCVLTSVKGIPTDKAVTARLEVKYTDQVKAANTEIAGMAVVRSFREIQHEQFNPDSNPHVATILRDIMKRKEGLQENGKYSVDEDVLEKIGDPLCKAILRLRKASKKLSTYIYSKTWPDGLLHPIFNTVFAETSRLSAEEPNLQNIPVREEEARELRAQLVARHGRVFGAADYGQIEARVFAMASKDKVFTKMLWERYDVHTDWAIRLATVYPDRIGGREYLKDKQVMKDFRGDIKNQWTFPLFFGAQLERVAHELSIPERKLEPELREFKRMFRGVFDWQEEQVEFYHANGYVQTLCGRRRRAPLSRNQVINTPIQGTAAEIVMDGMIRLSEYASKTGDWTYQPNLNIHDDLTFDLPVQGIDVYAEKIITEMVKVNFPFINVPITIEFKIGKDLRPYHKEKCPSGMKEEIVASSDDWGVVT